MLYSVDTRMFQYVLFWFLIVVAMMSALIQDNNDLKEENDRLVKENDHLSVCHFIVYGYPLCGDA